MAGNGTTQTKTFKAIVNLKKADDALVYLKNDGSRFDSPQTIKLQSNSNYKIDMSFRPASTLDAVVIDDVIAPVELKDRDHSVSNYTAKWNTSGFSISKKSSRENVKIAMKLGKGVLQIELQCKFYDETDTKHAQWGNRFSWIEYEFTISPDNTDADPGAFFKINKVTFR